VGTVRIALIGDYNPESKAHVAIPSALSLASDGERPPVWQWIHTSTLSADVARDLESFHGIWCVPGSPYANTAGVLAAIRFARTTGRPFLGTCGGFQHAMLEYAEALWKLDAPAHAETDPDALNPLIAPLACSLVEQHGTIHFVSGSRLSAICGHASAVEGYHCRYALNPTYADRLSDGPLRVSARDDAGDVRAVELDGHPFFFATLYQPERSALERRTHPLIAAFVAAAREHQGERK
jgi:CTP synthase (UTP-ammonia lyase)